MGSPKSLLTPVKQQKVYTQIVEQFINLIERGEFVPGMQLPSERELSKCLGVSRASLREALTVMQMMGLVETGYGQRAMICTKPSLPFFQSSNLSNFGESPFLILQSRRVIEPAIASLAATQHTESSLLKLKEILAQVEQDHSEIQVVSDVFSNGDRQFHLEIACLTENPFLISVQEMMHYFMGQSLWITLMRHTSFATPGRWQEAITEHRGIFEAIQSRDGHLAASRVKNHLSRVEKVMVQAKLVSKVPTENGSWD